MVEAEFNPTEKQALALEYLFDNETTELLFGGGAGGGKSLLGCTWIIIRCLQFKGSRWLIGRAVLKSIKESTLLTFFEMCKQFKLYPNNHYVYNSMEGTIKFWNGSSIYLKDLADNPSDPEFDSLGSTEYTGAFIDEASQVSSKAKNIVTSRLRYRINEFKTIPKLFIASNPTKNFLYSDFFKPSLDGTLPPYRKFVQALVFDNPHLPKEYIENLKKLDKVSRERLLEGNWHYDDDPAKIFEYDKIVDLWTNHIMQNPRDEKYLSVDVARFGKDKTTIFLWHGLTLLKVYSYAITTTDFVENKILELCKEHSIPQSNVTIDEDGVGGGVVDHIKNCKGFVNNSRPLQSHGKIENYNNLRSQCYFKLAEYVNQNKISIKEQDQKIKEALIEELEQVKSKNMDKDAKLQIMEKDKMKEILGRSPDYADAFMMRMIFEYRKRSTYAIG